MRLILYGQNTKLNIKKSICDFRKQYDSLFYAEYADEIVQCITTKKYPHNFFFRPAQRKCHQMFVISIDIQYLSAFDISIKKNLSSVSNKTGKYSKKLKFHLWDFRA